MQDPRQPKPVARTATPSVTAGVSAAVRDRLGVDPAWSHFALNGAWMCPYCLSAVRGHEDTRAALNRAVESHLGRRCTGWRNGGGRMQTPQTIADKRAFEDIAHRAVTDPAWQVFDHEGYWYSPASLQRVSSVRLASGRFDSFTIQNMASHLATCQHYQRGGLHPAPAVQRARDQYLRAGQLAANLRQLVQFALWRYTDASGQWVCPFCLGHSNDIILLSEADWQQAPERMAWHLAASCTAYVPERPEPKLEALVRQAASQTGLATVARTLAPGSLRIQSNSGGHRLAPVFDPGQVTTPATSAGARPTTRLAMPTIAESGARIATPLPRQRTPIPVAPPVLRTPPPLTRTPLPEMPVARPMTGRAQRNAAPLPIATPLPFPQQTTAVDPLAGTIFDTFDEPGHDSGAVSAPTQASTAAKEDESGAALLWMDSVEGHHDGSRDHHTDAERVRARDVQQNMLSKIPQLPGYRFATRFEACHDISGDFYEFITLADGRIGFAQGDVSGHGIHAGLIMSMAKKTLAIYALAGHGPAETLAQVNDSIVDDLGGKIFISLTYAILDPGMGTITWTRAGHNPAMRFNLHTNELTEIKPRGMVVGMKKGAIFRQSLSEEVTQVQAGDVFLVYTDGITETMNRQKVEYGTELLMEVVRRHAEAGPDTLLDRIMDSVRQFRGGSTADDDATLLAMTVE